MKFLYCIIFVVISVIAYEDNFYFNDTTGEIAKAKDVRYFVAIKRGYDYICNGVILAPLFALTPSNCIDFQDLGANIVVHSKSRFPPSVLYIYTKSIVNTSRFEAELDYHDVAFRMVVVKVDSEFGTHITLPGPDAVVPNRGTILFRAVGADEYVLVKKQFPTKTLSLNTSKSVLLYTDVTEEQKFRVNGASYIIEGTLYGMIVVDSAVLITGSDDDYILLLNIPSVVEKLRSALQLE